jgi:alpha-tubulin suppressor-like RCC1 family protein
MISFNGLLPEENIVELIGGADHTLALTSLGRVFAWGKNTDGLVGDGTNLNRSSPTLVTFNNLNSNEHIIKVSVSYLHNIVLTNQNRVFAWGWNGGQLGDGTLENSNTPKLINFTGLLQSEFIVDVYAGYSRSAAITNLGKVYTWGNFIGGYWDTSVNVNRTTPTILEFSNLNSNEKIIKLFLAQSFTFALTDQGSVFAWGLNSSSQLGDGTNVLTRSVPIKLNFSGLQSDEYISSLSVGLNHTLAQTNKGRLYSWGYNEYGQLGNGNNNTSNLPTLINFSGLDEDEFIVMSSADEQNSIALTNKGSVFSWGNNLYGTVGDGTFENRNTPVKISFIGLDEGEYVLSIIAGSQYNIAITSNGKVYSWGRNQVGQLGDGTTVNKNIPVMI